MTRAWEGPTTGVRVTQVAWHPLVFGCCGEGGGGGGGAERGCRPTVAPIRLLSILGTNCRRLEKGHDVCFFSPTSTILPKTGLMCLDHNHDYNQKTDTIVRFYPCSFPSGCFKNQLRIVLWGGSDIVRPHEDKVGRSQGPHHELPRVPLQHGSRFIAVDERANRFRDGSGEQVSATEVGSSGHRFLRSWYVQNDGIAP